jgi:hypothetical protein
MAQQLTKVISTAVFGAFAFWLPDVVIHALEGKAFGAGDVAIASLTMIVTVLASLRLDPHGRQTLVGLARGVAIVVSIWFLGPFLMMWGATFSGGGYAVSGAPLDWLFLLIPGIAFIIATYDGALGALLVVTVLVPLVCRSARSPARTASSS